MVLGSDKKNKKIKNEETVALIRSKKWCQQYSISDKYYGDKNDSFDT